MYMPDEIKLGLGQKPKGHYAKHLDDNWTSRCHRCQSKYMGGKGRAYALLHPPTPSHCLRTAASDLKIAEPTEKSPYHEPIEGP